MDSTTQQVLLVVFVATMIRSTFGFGEALIAVPLLALTIPIEIAAPVAVLLSITIAGIVVVQDWRKIHFSSTGWLLASTFPGTRLPFPLLGLDVDNDSAFINQTVVGYCKDRKIELTRSRAYKKNDQAWIEQKNGAVVRRMVGYGRLEGNKAVAVLAELHESARLYVNFFLPSFKLISKSRDGAKVAKKLRHASYSL